MAETPRVSSSSLGERELGGRVCFRLKIKDPSRRYGHGDGSAAYSGKCEHVRPGRCPDRHAMRCGVRLPGARDPSPCADDSGSGWHHASARPLETRASARSEFRGKLTYHLNLLLHFTRQFSGSAGACQVGSIPGIPGDEEYGFAKDTKNASVSTKRRADKWDPANRARARPFPLPFSGKGAGGLGLVFRPRIPGRRQSHGLAGP